MRPKRNDNDIYNKYILFKNRRVGFIILKVSPLELNAAIPTPLAIFVAELKVCMWEAVQSPHGCVQHYQDTELVRASIIGNKKT